MTRISVFAILLSFFAIDSCMQAEKVSLDTSGTEGLVFGGLSIELGLFGGGAGSTPLQWHTPEIIAVLTGAGRPAVSAGMSSAGVGHVLFADSPNAGQSGVVTVKVAEGISWTNQTLDSFTTTLYAPLPLDLAVNDSGAAIATWYNNQTQSAVFFGSGAYSSPIQLGSYCNSPAVALWNSGKGLVICGSLSAFYFDGSTFSTPANVATISTNDNALRYTPLGNTVYDGWYQGENHVYTYSSGSGWLNRNGPGSAMNIPTATDLNDSGQLLTIVSNGTDILGFWGNGSGWAPLNGTVLYSSPHMSLRTTLDSTGHGLGAWAGGSNIWIRFFSGAAWAPINVQVATGNIGAGPILAAGETGGAYLAWTETSGSSAAVRVATLDLTNQTVASIVTVGTGAADTLVDMAVSSSGQVIVAWSDNGIAGCGLAARCIKVAAFR